MHSVSLTLSLPLGTERKRFYRTVSVGEAPNSSGFVIKLDERQLRTPARTLLVLPTKTLAVGVAGEWDCQRPTIKPHLMPLVRSPLVIF